MQRSYGYPPNQQYGRDTTSEDYHAHISRIERTPSVLTDVPPVRQYPNVHKAFKNNCAFGEQQDQQKPPPQSKKSSAKKVQLTDQPVEIIASGTTDDENCEVQDETVDREADSFIKKKYRGFELCKWKTFKLL